MNPPPLHARDPALDLLRAYAILAVLAMHIVWMSPMPRPACMEATALGGLGVDLFFVLSGWLIGGLFWREHLRFGRVRIASFVLRRALRTVPPYAVALAIDAAVVASIRPGHANFNWRYLVFLQNYLPSISLFNISWSLCVEEHFYLVFPLCVSLLLLRFRRVEWFFAILLVTPAALRWLSEPAARLDEFAFPYYATHLHFEALVAGIWASWIRHHRPERWQRLQLWTRRWLVVVPLLVLAIIVIPEPWRYRLAFLLVAVAFAIWLVAWVDRPPRLPAAVPLLRPIALSAFSAYLVHMFAIHAAIRISTRPQFSATTRELAYYGVAGLAIAGLAGLFYLLVESPVQRLRKRLVPARLAA